MILVKTKHRPVHSPFNYLVDDFFNGFPSFVKNDFSTDYSKPLTPVNIKETEKDYQLEVVAPGFSKEDFKVSLDNNLLTVSAEKKQEAEKTEKHLRREYQYQSFERSFTVDDNVDAQKIAAQYVNGILTLNLPKKEEVKEPAKQINIQ